MSGKGIKENIRVVLWSGGKDSTATIILAHELGIKIDLIVMSLVWFDKKKKISAENTAHLKWVTEYAKPLFESWGYKVELVSSDKDYLYYFFFKRQKSEKHPETVGKYYGFPLGGFCRIQRLKEEPIKQFLKQTRKQFNVIEYVGICADEKPRLEKMHKRKNQISLLEQSGATQQQAKEKCKSYGLLSPIYQQGKKRGGCWFCPNQSIAELAELKQNEPQKYNTLKELAKVENTVARGFKYGKTFEQVDAEVDAYIAKPPAVQLSLFDYI